MDNINARPVLDFKTMTAILAANPEGVAIIGAWNGMEALAREDPEGCVRLCPGLPMDIPGLAGLFHCAVAIVEKAVEVFGNMRWLTVKDGLIRICSCAGRENADPARERQHELNRLRVRRFREKKKRESLLAAGKAEPVTDGVTDDVTGVTDDVMEVTESVMRDETDDVMDAAEGATRGVMDAVGAAEGATDGVMTAAENGACSETDGATDAAENGGRGENAPAITGNAAGNPAGKEKRKKQRKENYNNTLINHTLSSCRPFAPGERNGVIAPENLPAACRNVLDEWNRLPLPKKFTGLVPDLLRKLECLLQRYGEDTVRKTVAGIAGSAFLLGKKPGSSWTVSLIWLLEPENFAKVLSGKYRDRDGNYSGGAALLSGESCPFFLPGEGETPLDDAQRSQGLHDFFHPVNPALKKAAGLLGVA